MKKLLTVAAFAAAIASPAFAQTTSDQNAAKRTTADTRAMVRPQPVRPHSTNPSNDVYGRLGTYVGSDPDPQVRSMLQFDSASEENE
ncbi:MAG: hypothetical protein C5B56_05405 [Proteobacteria bacterium]|nr:MAG: hypothetical protein C5B56_05405 [Pseudomonadota bacterium]